MADASKYIEEPPEAGTYSRVLRSTFLALSQAKNTRFSGYNFSAKGFAVLHPDGECAVTLFFPPGAEGAAERATKKGWKDVSEMWGVGSGLVPNFSNPPIHAIKERLQGLRWMELLSEARNRGLEVRKKKRPEVEALLIDWFQNNREPVPGAV